jgi:hypothetical protein
MLRQSNSPWGEAGDSAIMLGDSGSRPKAYLHYFCCALPARACSAAFTWESSKKFWFSFLTVSTLCAKLLHIYAHIDSVKPKNLFLWGPTFFVQDAIFLLIVFALTRNFHRTWLRYTASTAIIMGT